jgi:hypothetical protein
VAGRTWILQAPKLYDIDTSLRTKPVIYWRTPQFVEQMKPGDHVLIWRAGKESGITGWMQESRSDAGQVVKCRRRIAAACRRIPRERREKRGRYRRKRDDVDHD